MNTIDQISPSYDMEELKAMEKEIVQAMADALGVQEMKDRIVELENKVDALREYIWIHKKND